MLQHSYVQLRKHLWQNVKWHDLLPSRPSSWRSQVAGQAPQKLDGPMQIEDGVSHFLDPVTAVSLGTPLNSQAFQNSMKQIECRIQAQCFGNTVVTRHPTRFMWFAWWDAYSIHLYDIHSSLCLQVLTGFNHCIIFTVQHVCFRHLVLGPSLSTVQSHCVVLLSHNASLCSSTQMTEMSSDGVKIQENRHRHLKLPVIHRDGHIVATWTVAATLATLNQTWTKAPLRKVSSADMQSTFLSQLPSSSNFKAKSKPAWVNMPVSHGAFSRCLYSTGTEKLVSRTLQMMIQEQSKDYIALTKDLTHPDLFECSPNIVAVDPFQFSNWLYHDLSSLSDGYSLARGNGKTNEEFLHLLQTIDRCSCWVLATFFWDSENW